MYDSRFFYVEFTGFFHIYIEYSSKMNFCEGIKMKFSIGQEAFYQAISVISSIVRSTANSPMFRSIKITSHSEGLTLAACNHDIFIEAEISLTSEVSLVVHEAGSVIVPAKHLIELVKKIPATITVSLDGNNKITIQAEDINVMLTGLDPHGYPLLPELKSNLAFKMPVNVLIEMMKQTSFAVSHNDSRPVLTGLLLSFQSNKVICAGTNSHRLALREQEFTTGIEGSYIVPHQSVKELIKLFSHSHEDITLYATDRYLLLKSHDITFYTRLIEGNYPNVSSLIPEVYKTTITISTNQLLKGIERACLFAKDSRNNNVKMEIRDGKSILISSFSSDLGKIEEVQHVESIIGEKDLVISLDGSFFADALKAFSEERICLSFYGSMKPVLIQPVDSCNHRHLVSPVRS